ncbi:MAG: hypothetical protein DRQ46_00125 [Gammaproteobacteria bacterium]|nr:MAG: hypothetical protein DRQ46_00125 [Gammaproteobacteria bacterium]
MKTEQLIYLASPYTDDSAKIVNERYEATCKITALLLSQGLYVYSPIVHGHCLIGYGLETDWENWKHFDKLMIDKSDIIYVLMIDGWNESIGVNAEIRYAIDLGMDVKYLDVNGEIQ